jgi:protein-disulfide isomerase
MASKPPRKQSTPSATRKQQIRDAKREEARLAAEKQARQKKQLMILGAIAGVAVAVVLALILINRDDSSSSTPAITDAPAAITVPMNGLTLGNPDAPVKIVEYGDYQCPYCGDFSRNGFHPLIDEFVASGDVQFTYVPMSFLGDESVRAAEAAMCANTQGQFWAMHESIYNNQFGENRGAFERSRLDQMAERIGLDMESFKACMDNGDQRGAVSNQAAVAQQDGVSSTPTFIINNGEPIGWVSWAALREEIVSALGG